MNTLINSIRVTATIPHTHDEITRLKAVNAELLAALEDAEFLLRKVGINWREAGSMSDSCKRSAEDARAAIAKAT